MSFHALAQHYVGSYGYAAVGLGILLENFGMPTPGETLLITGAVFAAHGTLDIRLLLLVAWLGASVGNTVGFAIGHWGGHRLLMRYGGRIGITEPRLQRVIRFFERYGDAVILFSRFFLVLRQLSGIAAGSLEMHWLRFLVLNAVGSALWAGFWGLSTYWLGGHIFRLLKGMKQEEPLVIIAVILLVALLIGLHFIWRLFHRPPGETRDSG